MKKSKYNLSISLAQLEKGPVVLTGAFPVEWLTLTDHELFELTSDIKYQLTALLITGNVLITGSISCNIKGSCGRCLNDTAQEILLDKVSLFFDEVGDAEELDITEDVRSELVLSLPMNLVCAESCQGLCPVCGCDLNIEECDCEVAPEESTEESPASPWGALDGLNL